MGLMTSFKANKAHRLQQNGKIQEAISLYEECFSEGLNEARYVLSYAVLIIRDGQYQKAKDFLVKHQKAPGMTGDYRQRLIVDYAVCCFRLGEVDKGIAKMEELQRKGASGAIYQTLGYLYVEKYDLANKPDFAAAAAEAEAAVTETAPETEPAAAEEDAGSAAPALTPEEQWQAGAQKALEYNQAAVEYDDEDPICLDNLAQTWYRVMGDKEQAKPWFEKALAVKDNQIDTLYFLSRYDLENGDRAAALEKLEKAAEGRFSPLNYCTRDNILAEIAALKGEA